MSKVKKGGIREMVRRFEVAKFFAVESAEVDRWISDGLPVTKLPMKERKAIRIWLRDLHDWLLEAGEVSERLRKWEDFRQEFARFQNERILS